MAKEKILVVDDEADILELVRYNLSREGYHVTGTLTGEDALRKVRSDPFDLIILDLMLPGRDGIEICQQMRQVSDVPIIMITSRVGDKHRARAIELGVNDYLGKPYQDAQLLEAIRRQLEEKGIFAHQRQRFCRLPWNQARAWRGPNNPNPKRLD